MTDRKNNPFGPIGAPLPGYNKHGRKTNQGMNGYNQYGDPIIGKSYTYPSTHAPPPPIETRHCRADSPGARATHTFNGKTYYIKAVDFPITDLAETPYDAMRHTGHLLDADGVYRRRDGTTGQGNQFKGKGLLPHQQKGGAAAKAHMAHIRSLRKNAKSHMKPTLSVSGKGVDDPSTMTHTQKIQRMKDAHILQHKIDTVRMREENIKAALIRRENAYNERIAQQYAYNERIAQQYAYYQYLKNACSPINAKKHPATNDSEPTQRNVRQRVV